MPETLIRAENLSFSYALEGSESISAIKELSLEVAVGEYLAVVGHNGSGKSTLAKCLCGLLVPTSGSVSVAGLDTRQPSNLVAIRAQVGMVFQNPDNQFVSTVVEEEVAFGAENLGVPLPELRERVDAALQATGLLELRDAKVHTLSAGQKTRLAIADVLVMQPRGIILDESTAMLDPINRLALLSLLRDLHQRGLAIILVTHYMHEALDAQRILVLKDGRQALAGTPREVFAHEPELQALSLELPLVTQLALAFGRRGWDIGLPLNVDELLAAMGEARRA
ncbi:MAG: ATP-binding cassette domain-containing protein [Chloroflexi bacterium]|nr:ATP-binding cassette domain-containing protein [Chloroflexota bacterium]